MGPGRHRITLHLLAVVLLSATVGCGTCNPGESTLDKPPYEIEVVSPVVQYSTGQYISFAVRGGFTQINSRGRNYEKTLAAEYESYVTHLKKAVADSRPKLTKGVFKYSWDKSTNLVSLTAKGVSLDDVVDKLEETGLNIMRMGSLKVPVDVSLDGVKPEDALRKAAQSAGVRLNESQGIFITKELNLLADIPLPGKVSDEQCRFYVNNDPKDKHLFGEIIIMHENEMAVHIEYKLIKDKTTRVLSARLYATYIDGR